MEHDRSPYSRAAPSHTCIWLVWKKQYGHGSTLNGWDIADSMFDLYSHRVRHFLAASPSVAKRSAVASVVFTVTSSQGHVNHLFTITSVWRSLIHRILKSLLPQNNTFFIATASIVKDAEDDPDCQGLREQWYYLRFYVRRTMLPTAKLVANII